MARKAQLRMEERQTIITLRSVGLLYTEILKKVKVSVLLGETLTRGGLADPKAQQLSW